MIENGLFLTGNDAELLSRALAEVKTKVYEESEASLDDTQALKHSLSCVSEMCELEEPENRKSSHVFLAHWVSALCLARLSVDKATPKVARVKRIPEWAPPSVLRNNCLRAPPHALTPWVVTTLWLLLLNGVQIERR